MNSTEATVGQASLAWHGWSLVLELREGGGKTPHSKTSHSRRVPAC